ncbi:MAG: cobalt ECF transporter T component CbiQ [Nitrospirota bacterium]|nr:cobalt ECF transporter T component CbiQ [Nitrospirota bacterium]
MALDIDRYAHVESSVQRWDPRFKIFSLGILILCISLLKTLPMAAAALAIAALMLVVTGLPYHFISHGLNWVILFLLPFFLVMPFTYPGETSIHILGLGFALEGLRLASLIFIKAVAIVMTSYAIFGSARFDVSMIALQRLKCPTALVQMLLFTYRYIFVFMEEMKRMNTAMRVRGFVLRSNLYTLKVLGNFIGSLLVRSFERTERVYKAMLSKGYNGQFHTLVTFSAGAKDLVKAVLVIALAAGLVAGDLGGWFTQAAEGWY